MYLTDLQGISMTILKTGLIGLVVSAVLYALFGLITRKRFPVPMRTHVLRYVFLTYLVCLLLLTLSPQAASTSDVKSNFVPFFSVIYALKSGFQTAQYLVILNILLFVPMGIFLPCVFRKADRFYRTVLTAFAVTLFIELVQVLLPGRAFDIDDILMNTLGAAIGYALFTLCVWIWKKREQKKSTRILSLVALALIPVFLLAFHLISGNKEFVYSFSYYINAPSHIEIKYEGNLPNTAEVYCQTAYDPYSHIQKLMGVLGIEGKIEEDEFSLFVTNDGMSLSQSKERNGWQCELRNSYKEKADLEEMEVVKAAKTTLKKYGLWRDGAQLDSIDEDYTDTSGKYPEGFALEEDPITGELIPPEGVIESGKIVSFSIEDGINNWSINVHIDKAGVWKISCLENSYEYYKTVELISPKEALQALAFTDKCVVGFDNDDKILIEPQSMVVDQVSLSYMDGNNLKYMLPAWKLEGEFYGMVISDSGATQMEYARGFMIVEAIRQ